MQVVVCKYIKYHIKGTPRTPQYILIDSLINF